MADTYREGGGELCQVLLLLFRATYEHAIHGHTAHHIDQIEGIQPIHTATYIYIQSEMLRMT